MSDANEPMRHDAPPPFIERLSGFIALIGGLVLFCVAILVVVSVIGRWLSGTRAADIFPWLGPINGDFEMVQIATAIAVFSFLPYAQARRANIVVDTFTSGLPARAVSLIDAFWDLVYAGMMGLITACLATGVVEHYRSGQTTMLLQLTVWPALAVCTLLSLFLTCVALTTAVALIRGRT